MNREYLLRLLDFHYWARDRMLDSLAALAPEQYARALGNSFSSVQETANHIFHAEWIWHSRWKGESPSAADRPSVPDLAALRRAWSELEQKVRAYVAALDDAGIGRVYEYRTLAGTEMRSRFWEMLVHLVNHASYHRGQIVTMMRQLGAGTPVATDMIAFFRERP